MPMEEMGKVSLQCAAGRPVYAKLVKPEFRLVNEEMVKNNNWLNIGPSVPVICAVVENMTGKESCLLHPEILTELRALPQIPILDAQL